MSTAAPEQIRIRLSNIVSVAPRPLMREACIATYALVSDHEREDLAVAHELAAAEVDCAEHHKESRADTLPEFSIDR